MTQLAKYSSDLWNNMNEVQRQKYEELAEKDKLRWECERNDLLTKGFFMMADGSKSSDHVNKKRRRGSPKKKGKEEK